VARPAWRISGRRRKHVIDIITIEREFGAGAPAIGKALAARLGFKLWDHEITDEIARRLHCKAEIVEKHEERLDSVFYRLMKAFMRGSFEARVETTGFEALDAERLAQMFEQVISNIADQGKCVIIGRGSPWFLRERDNAFHVFLFAPYEEKFRRVLAMGKTEAETENLLETVDRERAAFICKYYQKDWPSRELYDMMMNVKHGDDIVVESILSMIEARNRTPVLAHA
jgi:cytidylate kinase